MTSPLDLPALVPTLIITWTGALVTSAIVALFLRRRLTRPFRFPLLQFGAFVGAFGCMMTIAGIAQLEHDRGFITFRLQAFTSFLAALTLVLAVAMVGRRGPSNVESKSRELAGQ
jgi:hypothetical protein